MLATPSNRRRLTAPCPRGCYGRPWAAWLSATTDDCKRAFGSPRRILARAREGGPDAGGAASSTERVSAPRRVRRRCGSVPSQRHPPLRTWSIRSPPTVSGAQSMHDIVVLQPLVALISGILILLIPRLLNYVVAIYLIVIGIIGLWQRLFYHVPH